MDKVHYVKDKNNVIKQVEDLEAVKQCVSLTYAALKALRDQGKLSPGQYYRITDYVTVTVQADTQSAGHQFDVIVRADSPSVLSETAWAAKHDGDNYFASSKLEAWQLKYCIDNDVARFGWVMRNSIIISNVEYLRSESDDVEGAAYPYCWVSGTNKRYTASETPSTGSGQAHSSSTGGSSYSVSAVYTDDGSGKGVIYWMKDEFGNEFPFDFKNIQFKRYKITATSKVVEGQEVLASLKNTYLGFRKLEQNGTGQLYPQNCTMSTSDTRWSFALSLNGTQDLTLQANHHCTDNVVEPCFFGSKQYLNNVTLQATGSTDDSYNNHIDGTSHSISMGSGCYNNTLTQGSHSCTLSSSGNNTLSSDSYYNTLSSSYNNTLSSSESNTLSSSNNNTLSSNFFAELIGCYNAVLPEGSAYEQGIGGYMVEDGLYIKNYGQRRTVNVFLAEYGSEDGPVIDETITLEAGQVYYRADTYFEPSEDSQMTFTEGGKTHKYGFSYY